MDKTPIIGDTHHFFADGKITPGRHYVANVIDIIDIEQSKNVFISYNKFNKNNESIILSLYDIWIKEVNEHIDWTGKHWLYSPSTDYFVKCSIPEYDNEYIWFVRTIYGNWFSLETTNCWMGGRLMPINFEYTINKWNR